MGIVEDHRELTRLQEELQALEAEVTYVRDLSKVLAKYIETLDRKARLLMAHGEELKERVAASPVRNVRKNRFDAGTTPASVQDPF